MGTGVRGSPRLLGVEAQPKQMALVAQKTPDLAPNGGIVAVVPPPAPYPFAAPRGFECFQGLHGEQRTAMHLTQQKQDITCQMRECPIALFILAPTPVNFPPIECKSLVEPCSFGVIRGQDIPLLFVGGRLFLELVDLPSRAGLSAIKTARVEEHWPAHLFVVFIYSGRRE